VLKQRERNQRGSRLLRLDILEQLARERLEQESVLQARLHALEVCLQKLPPADRELIQERYQNGLGAAELVRRAQTSRRTLFRRLERIRRGLQRCIDRQLAAGT